MVLLPEQCRYISGHTFYRHKLLLPNDWNIHLQMLLFVFVLLLPALKNIILHSIFRKVGDVGAEAGNVSRGPVKGDSQLLHVRAIAGSWP